MHLIFITADHKDATIVQKQSYQRKKSEYYPSSLWKFHLKQVKQH